MESPDWTDARFLRGPLSDRDLEELLQSDRSGDAAVRSVTSFGELARDAKTAGRRNMLHPEERPSVGRVEQYAYPNPIASFVPGD